jgi:hypothetical protein
MSDPSPFVANPYLLPVSLAACLTGLAALAFIAMRSAREARSTIFPVVREEETVRARRARYGMAFLSFLSGGIIAAWIITGGPAASRPEPQPTSGPSRVAKITPSPTPLLSPTFPLSPSPTLPPAPSPTLPPSPTPPPDNTPTTAPTAVPTADFSNALPASDNAHIGPLTLSRGVEDKKPVEPTNSFLLDGNAIYAVFPYEGMRNGVRWAIVWYRGDQEIVKDEELWKYGVQDVMYRYFVPGVAGNYKVVIYLEDKAIASADFEVQKMGIGGPKETSKP